MLFSRRQMATVELCPNAPSIVSTVEIGFHDSSLTILHNLFVEQKLADLSAVPTARLIDGILLTKFDTIDDKV